jgi:hypothetical protein
MAYEVLDTVPENKVFIIPIRLDDCQVPSKLKDIHWLNFFEPNGKEKLIETLITCTKQSKTPQKINMDSERMFDVGDRIKTVRLEIGVKASEFVDALGLSSEREYLAMEMRSSEVPLSVLKRIHDLTGVSLGWMKHGEEPRYRVEKFPISPVDKAVDRLSAFNPENVFFVLGYTKFSFAPENLLVCIVLQTKKYFYQVVDYGISLNFWDWNESHWAIPLIYRFLSDVLDTHGGPNGIFVPINISKQLLEGQIHFHVVEKQAKLPYRHWHDDILDVNCKQRSRLEYEKFYGNWITKVQDAFADAIAPKKTALQETTQQFHNAMRQTYEAAKAHGYQPVYFKIMLDQLGAVGAAKALLAKNEIQEGLMKLWELKLLDQSMEAFVIQEQFQPLFTQDEIAEARRRLEELGGFKK